MVATLVDVVAVAIPRDTVFRGEQYTGSPITNDGLRPNMHRMMSLGHDPLLGFVWGTFENMLGVGSLIDRRGPVHFVSNPVKADVNPITSIAKVAVHRFSDVFIKAGLQPPGFTLVQCVSGKSPFVLQSGGARVSFNDASRWMYGQGYTMGHFATMSLVPLIVEIVIRTWHRMTREVLATTPWSSIGHAGKGPLGHLLYGRP